MTTKLFVQVSNPLLRPAQSLARPPSPMFANPHAPITTPAVPTHVATALAFLASTNSCLAAMLTRARETRVVRPEMALMITPSW